MEQQPVIRRFFVEINGVPARVFLNIGENNQYACVLTATENSDARNAFDSFGFRITITNIGGEKTNFEPIPLWKGVPSKLTNEVMMSIWTQILSKGIDNPD